MEKNFCTYTTYYYHLIHAYPDCYHLILNEDMMTGLIIIDIMEYELIIYISFHNDPFLLIRWFFLPQNVVYLVNRSMQP